MHGSLPGWTDEKIAIVRRVIGEGASAGEAAKAAGVTRNALIGKCRRLGIALNNSKSGPRKPRPARRPIERKGPIRRSAIKAARDAAQNPYRTPLPPAPDFIAGENPAVLPVPAHDLAIPIEQRCTLLTLKKNSCRWPVGDPKLDPDNFFFCGGERVEGSSYCAHHKQRSEPRE